jgi:hypothetical protein
MKNKGRLKRVLGGLIRETAQSLPIVGTVITNWKENEVDNPKGQVNLRSNDWYRILIGIGVAYLVYKGVVSLEFVEVVSDVMDKV